MKIKYIGISDIRRLEKGEDFGGQLAEPLDRDIEWNWENRHVIDTDDYEGVDDEFWSLLLEYGDDSGKEFKDVTDAKRIPTNLAQQTWRAMPKTEESPDAAPRKTGTDTSEHEPPAGGGPSEATATSGPTTTTGGSTKASGRTGGSTRNS